MILPYVAVAGGLYWFISELYTVPVMMYHNVANVETFREDTVSVRNFEQQLQFIHDHGYKVLSVEELVEGLKTGKRFPHGSVVITFDDGNKNNYTTAFPILRRFGYSAHFFISPGTIGTEGSLTWDDVERMHLGGMHFGSHGMIQAYLPKVPLEDQLYEIKESRKVLEAKLKSPVEFYAYPIGGFNKDIQTILRESGYKAAFTTNRGYDRFDKDLYEINRIRFGDRDTAGWILSAKLSGYYNLFRKLKNPE